MYTEHVQWHSNALGRPMEFLWYGKFGRPVMLFPTSSGRYSENADRGIPEGCVRVAAAHPLTSTLGPMFGPVALERA